jgi:hypothetical protein
VLIRKALPLSIRLLRPQNGKTRPRREVIDQ